MKTLSMDQPLIYTKNGNVPIDSLRYEHEWIENEQHIFLHERWFDGEEMVKNNMHGYVKRGLSIAGEQAKM